MIFAWSTGNVKSLIQPYDPDHNACGLDATVVNFPYIYFAAPLSGTAALYTTVCVS